MPAILKSEPITTSEKTFVQMRRDIITGKIAQGSKLSETELASRYSVSRAIIREAMGRLESARLVERRANVGARVTALTPEGLIKLYEVREALEGMAARLAAQNMTDTEIKELQDLLHSHEDMVKTKRYYQEDGNVDFHYLIMVGSKNDHLISLLVDGIYHLGRMYRVQLGMAGPRVATAFNEHQNIVAAIANRDAELAEILMRRHISYTKTNLENKLLGLQSAKA